MKKQSFLQFKVFTNEAKCGINAATMGQTRKNPVIGKIEAIFLSVVLAVLKTFQFVGDAVIWILKGLVKIIVSIVKTIFSLSNSVLSLFLKFKDIRFKLPKIKLSLPSFPKIKLPGIKIPKIEKPAKKRGRPSAKTPVPFGRKIKIFFYGFVICFVLITVPLFVVLSLRELPNPKILTARSVPVTTKIYDRNGELLYEIYADQNRTPVALAEIPKDLINAAIAVEDSEFYTHKGYSLRGIVRAAAKTVFEDNLQGGSTITQQLIRSALLTREISLERKVKEIILSIWAEQIYSKDEILEMYFNQVPYGGTAWGVEAASQTYFGKSVRDLDLAEAALLAGLPAAPSTFSPFGPHPELAFERQKEVLRRMAENRFITNQQKDEALEEKIKFTRPNIGLNAPHFVMYIRDLLAQKYGIRMVEQGGLRVETSLDLNLQKKLEEIVRREVSNLAHLQVGNAAVLVTDPKTGEILAMVGSVDYFDIANDGNVNVALTPQQPGSSIKIVNYSAALQNGFTAATLINDSPITYKFNGAPSYSPVNYDQTFHGWVALRDALGNSYNIPAVRTLAKIGVSTMIDQGRKMGIDSWYDPTNYGLSLTLGGGEVTMLEMAQVYNTLANKGFHQNLSPIIKVTDYQGVVLEEDGKPNGNQAMPAEVAFIISDILSDNRARTSAFGSSSLLYIPNQWVAVKTGTSNEKRDNWAIGYTDSYVVTVWVGNNDNSPMHPTLASGITGATPIWRDTIDVLLEGKKSSAPTPPENIAQVDCRGKKEYFVKGTEAGACKPIPTPSPSISPTP